MTVTALARASSLTKGFISQVEGGKSNPSLTSLARIALALRVPLSWLLAGDATGQDIAPLAASPALLASRNTYERVSGLIPVAGIDTGTHYLAAIPVGYELNSHLNAHSTPTGSALALVLQGSIDIVQSDIRLPVTRTECASFNPSLPYSLANNSDMSALLFVFVPSGSPAPSLTRRAVRAVMARPAPAYSSAVEGPMRLAAMRAERQKMGGR